MTLITDTTDTTAAENLVRSLYRLGLVQREIARHALAELGSQGFTALAIVHKYGPIRISDIARRLSVDLSVASRQVAALEAAGHVRRQPDPEDRRAHRITTTETGTRVLTESHRRMVAAFAGALADWPEDDVLALAGGLDRLREDFARPAAAEPQSEEVAR
jgi:DNA-binding MarR family transcriptional regulator